MFLLFIPVLAVCQNRIRLFTILGRCSKHIEGYIYMSYKNSLGKQVLDSSTIKLGKFQIEGDLVTPTQAVVSYSKNSYTESNASAQVIYIEPGKMHLHAKFVNNQPIFSLAGSRTETDFEWLSAQKKIVASDKFSKARLLSLERQFIDKHPESVISSELIALNYREWPLDTIIQLYSQLDTLVKQSEYAVMVNNWIKVELDNAPGKPAQGFSATSFRGDSLSLGQFIGKYVLLDFWASWCAPCRQSFPILKVWHAKYHYQGLEIIGISEDEKVEAWKKAIDDDGIGALHQILSGCNVNKIGKPEDSARISGRYGVNYFPTKILIDRNGIIVGKWVGESPKVVDAIDALLQMIF